MWQPHLTYIDWPSSLSFPHLEPSIFYLPSFILSSSSLPSPSISLFLYTMSIETPHPLDALSVNETNTAREILLAARGQYSPDCHPLYININLRSTQNHNLHASSADKILRFSNCAYLSYHCARRTTQSRAHPVPWTGACWESNGSDPSARTYSQDPIWCSPKWPESWIYRILGRCDHQKRDKTENYWKDTSRCHIFVSHFHYFTYSTVGLSKELIQEIGLAERT